MNLTLRITLVFLLLCGGGFYWFVRAEVDETKRRYREATEEPLADIAQILAAVVAQQAGDTALSTERLASAFATIAHHPLRAQIYDFEKTTMDLRIYVTDAQGTVLFDSDEGSAVGQNYSQWRDVYYALRGAYGARTSRDNPRHKGSILYVAAPIRRGGQIIGSLTVAKPNETADLFIAAAERSTWYGGTVVFLAVSLLAALLTQWVTRPLLGLTAYARAVRDGTRATLPASGSGEIRTLGKAFEEMREALEGRKYIERYVQTLTHELKSPLTGIRGAAELLREELPPEERARFLKNINRETVRIQALIDQLLALSSLQTMRELGGREDFDLAEVLLTIADSYRPLASQRGITVDVQAPPLVVNAHRFWVTEAVSNLVQNALDFSPRNGATVELVSEATAQQVTITVRDSGPGVPEWALTKVFEQFYSLPRPGHNKRSSGLGLNIVREVATLHGGRAELRNGVSGGAIAELTLPMRAAARV